MPRVVHPFVSGVSDGADATKVRPSNWNADHTVAFTGAKAYLSSGQSIANNSNVAVGLAAEEFDTDGFHDNATNNTRFTIPSGKAGKYLVVGQVAHELDTAGTTRGCNIHKNGTMVGQQYLVPNQSFDTVVQAHAILDLIAGDYVELVAYQNSGSANNAVAGATETWMAITHLGS